MRRAAVYFHERLAGTLTEDDEGYAFAYDDTYLAQPSAQGVSLTLPLRPEPFRSRAMLPFFDGLIPEGWLLDIVVHNWKIDRRDRMSLLLTCCKDCIGAVSVRPMEGEGDV